MFIKKLRKDVYDVFLGDGWNNWSRVQRTKQGIGVIAGLPLDQRVLNIVQGRVR